MSLTKDILYNHIFRYLPYSEIAILTKYMDRYEDRELSEFVRSNNPRVFMEYLMARLNSIKDKKIPISLGKWIDLYVHFINTYNNEYDKGYQIDLSKMEKHIAKDIKDHLNFDEKYECPGCVYNHINYNLKSNKEHIDLFNSFNDKEKDIIMKLMKCNYILVRDDIFGDSNTISLYYRCDGLDYCDMISEKEIEELCKEYKIYEEMLFKDLIEERRPTEVCDEAFYWIKRIYKKTDHNKKLQKVLCQKAKKYLLDI